jgi:hypothetical protein
MMEPGEPVRQPCARVDYIPQSGTKNLATGLPVANLQNNLVVRVKWRTKMAVRTTFYNADLCLIMQA